MSEERDIERNASGSGPASDDASSAHHVGQHVMALARLARTYLDPRLAEFGIGFSQAQMLMALYRGDGVSQDELARRLNITKGAMTRTIQRLVSAGYVERLANPGDERAYRLVLTDKAHADRDAIRTALRGWTNGATADFTDDEYARLHELLVRMVDNAAEMLAEDHRAAKERQP
jgi:MarR family transcriptional regulator, transcriptional regulator for hemolysin